MNEFISLTKNTTSQAGTPRTELVFRLCVVPNWAEKIIAESRWSTCPSAP